MIAVRAGPPYATVFQTVVRNTSIGGGQRGYFSHYFSWMRVIPFITHFPAELTCNFPVRFTLSYGIDCLAHSLYETGGVGKCPVFFSEGTGRQNHIGDFCCFSQEHILHHYKIHIFHYFSDVIEIGATSHRIAAYYIKAFNLAFCDYHIRFCYSGFHGKFCFPCLLELFVDLRI